MVAYFKPHCRCYDILLPMGCHVLLQSKMALLKKWYFDILPCLESAKSLTSRSILSYLDTGQYPSLRRCHPSSRHFVISLSLFLSLSLSHSHTHTHTHARVHTDSLYIWVECHSAEKLGRFVRFSELCWILRDHLDLSDILPISGTRERSLYYEELLSVLKPQGWTEAALRRELSKNFGRPFTLKFEFPRLKSSYYSIVKSVWHVREKCYCVNIIYQTDVGTDVRTDLKKANRGGVTRARLENFGESDYAQMSASSRLIEAEGLRSFKSFNFQIFENTYSRTVSTSYSRKRHILSTGLSTPFNMYLNEDLDESDKQYMKRRKIK